MHELYTLYIRNRKSSDLKESTRRKTQQILQCNVLTHPIAKVHIDKLDSPKLEQWKASLVDKGLKFSTRQNIYGEFRALLNYAVRMGYLNYNPLNRIGNFKNPHGARPKVDFYEPDEFKKFISVAKDRAINEETKRNSLYEWNYYVFFCIAFYTGMRKGEIYGLRWTDVNNGYISIERSVNQKLEKGKDIETTPKNASSIRVIKIPEPLKKILEEHKMRQMKLSSFKESNRILGDGDKCPRDSSITNRNAQYAKEAGVKRIRIHDFRHTHASLLINAGVNIQEIARRLGHSKIEITWNTYSHLYPQEEEKAMNVLNQI